MKLIVDILMFILMTLQFMRGYIPPIFHEISGIVLFVLVIVHLILNKNYIKNLFKGRYNFNRALMAIIAIVFFATFFTSAILGMFSSQEALIFLNRGNYNINHAHKVISFISLIILSLHLGINFNAMFGKLFNKYSKTVFYIVEGVIIICGIYSFIDLDLITLVSGRFGFSSFDGNPYIIYIEYISVILMITFLTYNVTKLANKINNK
jgi:hypothetical protein